MRILIFGINYAPELTGIGKYTGEMASWLGSKGHEVSVITSMPYYPEWAISSSYQSKLWITEEIDGISVNRCPLYVPKRVTSLTRIIHELSFLLSSLPIWLKFLFRKKYDIVICVSPPFHLGIIPLVYCKIKNANLVTHIQDLQVDAAKELGMIKNDVLLNVMFKIESILLNECDAVSTISSGMEKRIILKGTPTKKMIMLPNWVDENIIRPLPKSQSLRNQFGISSDMKVVMYSGNLGEKQGLEIILTVAKSLEYRDDILFLIVGSGGIKDKLLQTAMEINLQNVVFFPLQPYEKMSALLATADLHLVLQKKSAADLVMPSKLTAILASGGCAIVTAVPGTSLYDVIYENKIGILLEPESAIALERGIESAFDSNLTSINNAARRFAEKNLTKEGILDRFEENLLNLLHKTTAGS